MDDRTGELQDGVEQPDQNGDVLRTTKNLLEHEVDGWFDSAIELITSIDRAWLPEILSVDVTCVRYGPDTNRRLAATIVQVLKAISKWAKSPLIQGTS